MTRIGSPTGGPRPADPGAPAPPAAPTTTQVVLAFAAVYLIWGSTYYAIRIAIETIPPFTMAGVRFLLAGGVLYPWVRLRRRGPAPTALQWRNAGILGVLLLGIGNGAVVWAEQWVPTGLVALLVGLVPIWMVLVDWLWGTGPRPGPLLIGGLVWGLLGVGLLASGDGLGSDSAAGRLAALVVLAGGVAWAVGSVGSRSVDLPSQPGLATAMQMLTGGGVLLAVGAASGELGRLDPAHVSSASVLAFLYLAVFGSLIAFSAFTFLLGVTTPARVSTYAYVNPVVALLLGWGLAGEPITGRTLLAAAIILSAVVLITRRDPSRT